MKTSIKTIACTLVVFVVLSSCNKTDNEDDLSYNSKTEGSIDSSDSSDNSSSTLGSNSSSSASCIDCGNVAYDEVVTQMPIMDERVVSYKKLESTNVLYYALSQHAINFVVNKDSLILLFPNISDEQADKCFAINNKRGNFSYSILSYSTYLNNLRLYTIMPDNYDVNRCILKGATKPEDMTEKEWNGYVMENYFSNGMENHIMLICDDTGELKKNSLNPDYLNPDLEWIDLYRSAGYNDPNWDCEKGFNESRGVFF